MASEAFRRHIYFNWILQICLSIALVKMMKEFICQKCGECCRHLDAVESLNHLQVNGICRYLRGNLCDIYDHRPNVCDYKRAYELFKDKLTENEYHDLCVIFCDQLLNISNNGKKNDRGE